MTWLEQAIAWAQQQGIDPRAAVALVGGETGFGQNLYNPRDPNGGSHGVLQINGPQGELCNALDFTCQVNLQIAPGYTFGDRITAAYRRYYPTGFQVSDAPTFAHFWAEAQVADYNGIVGMGWTALSSILNKADSYVTGAGVPPSGTVLPAPRTPAGGVPGQFAGATDPYTAALSGGATGSAAGGTILLNNPVTGAVGSAFGAVGNLVGSVVHKLLGVTLSTSALQGILGSAKNAGIRTGLFVLGGMVIIGGVILLASGQFQNVTSVAPAAGGGKGKGKGAAEGGPTAEEAAEVAA